MVVMAFKNPVMGLMATNLAFEKFETEGTKQKLLAVKAVYVAMQVLALALGVWKVNGMGLLPYVLFHEGRVAFGLIDILGLRNRIGWLGRRRGIL